MSDPRATIERAPGPGERFGEYQLIRHLTTGGMADLFLARGPDSDRDIVLKRIQQRFVAHNSIVRLFVDEGRIAQTLEHPNIVRTTDVGDVAGTFYIAMEYIPGHDLIAVARRGMETGRFIPRPIAAGIVAQVASGLAYAHSNRGPDGKPLSIVHCDISPGNIVVSTRGTAKIVDFGIARAAIQLRSEDGVAGKFNYMAPEQIRGEKVDARADLFSLGVILYELTLGKRLFKGKPAEVRRKVLEGPIARPRDVRPDYPATLERIVGRLLARDPEQRYPSAAALRSDLGRYLKEEERGWGKREIAQYLRDLFSAPLGVSGDGEGEFASTGDESSLPGMPKLEEVEADADDLFDLDEGAPEASEGDRTPPPMPGLLRVDDYTPTDGIEAPPVAAAGPDEEDDEPVSPPPRIAPARKEARLAATQQQSLSGQIAARAGGGPTVEPSPRKVVVDVSADPTTRVTVPGAPPTRRTPEHEPPTALVRMPGPRRRDPRALEVTEVVRNPPRRRKRHTIELSTEMVVGGCIAVAALLLALVFLVGR